MKTGHRAQRRPACASLGTVSRPPKVTSSMRTQSATVRRKSLFAPRDPLVTLRGGAAETSASRVGPWGALGSRPRRVLGSHPSHPRERVRVCAQPSLAIEGRICGSRGHVTRVAAGSRARGRRWRQSLCEPGDRVPASEGQEQHENAERHRSSKVAYRAPGPVGHVTGWRS